MTEANNGDQQASLANDKVQLYMLYVQVGTEMITLGAMAYERIRALFETGESQDPATLARIDADYADRIGRAKANGAE
jgi:hypothetical protein